MKIEKIEIYGYGKWLHKEFSHLEAMQIFLGNNEAGKSTLSSFIHTLFFGFPSTRKKDFNTYVPKQGETYGGRLFLSGTRFGEVIIERLKERNRGKATLTYSNGQQEVIDHLASYLLGVDGETYELLYTFKIDRLLELNKVKKDDLNRYLLGVGTSGSEKILQLSDQYRKDAQKEFKPTGTIPPLNKKIKDTEELAVKLQKAKQKNAQYEQLLLDATALQDQIMQAHTHLQKMETDNRDLSEAIRLNDYYQEWNRLSQNIERVDTSILPKDAQNQWERLQGKIAEDLLLQTSLQQQMKTEQKIAEDYSHAEWYQATKKEWNAVQHEVASITTQMNRQQFLEQQLKQEEIAIFLFKRNYRIEDRETLPILDEQEEQAARELVTAERQLTEQLERLHQTLRDCEKNVDDLEMRIQAEEEKLVPEQQFKKWEQLAKQPVKEEAALNRKMPVGIVGVLLVVALLSLILLPEWRLYLAIVAAGLLGVMIYLLNKKKPVIADEPADSFSMDSYIQQATLRERVREWKKEEETAQERLIQILNQQEGLETQMEQEKEKQAQWLEAMNYPPYFSIDRVLQDQPALALANLAEKRTETATEIEKIEDAVASWEEKARFIRSHFDLEHLDTENFLHQFNELHQSVVLEESMANNTNDKVKELKEQLKDVHERLQTNTEKRQNLLKNANVETEAEFYELLHAKEEQTEQKRRRDFLAEQLAGKETILAKYADKEKATKKLQRNQQKIVELSQQIKDWQKKEISLQHDIHLLEEGGTYSTLLQEYAMAETELRDLMISWGKKVIAAEWLEDTLRYGKEDRLPYILSDMTEYFKRLTDGVYTRIVFQKSGIKVQHQNGIVYQPYELSKGTVEQLYISMRFSFIKNTADIANLPILIDDGFVNFDPKRKKLMYELMKELSETVQVFFFTFDHTVQGMFADSQVRVLEETR
ncbi:ATP-binding protein [Jeotgalibaca caeni]|uniref:ATP-binding protein n=1 Tax=Jeotgalibaca caeni TaxID=3028623 RepID=UPI00237D7C71|nr:AAA family ATPase [Jeotgalibaca caeni]MDE1548375.1 AAA family ATPase [Jeotgalibaca caeni]